MNFPENIEEKIGFDQIRKKVAGFCYGEPGKELVYQAKFSSKHKFINHWQTQNKEWLQILNSGDSFAEGYYFDVSKALKKLEIEGYFLSEQELHHLLLTLITSETFINFFKKKQELYPLLAELVLTVSPQKEIISAIQKVLNEQGEMRNNASPELAELNSNIAAKERNLIKKAKQLYLNAKKEGWTADLELGIKEGRMVLPVIAEHKRKVQGIVHDESASGNILFIEPAEIIQLSNEIKAFEIARKREIERILKKLTEYIAPHREALKQTSKVLATVDFVRAKALFAYQYNAQTPEVDSQPLVFWQNAYHPLLLLHNKQLGLPTIPQQFDLNMDNRIMVISGPNAGGKSVAMKTVALLQFMLQCGFPVTAMNNQKAGVFKQLFIDIGDDQSLDNDLSTYSSHLKNMKYFCDFANGSTLVFIDEFGTGTDPQFGGPIAEAILEELNRKRCFAVVTTHYSNLKLLADKTKGICNAAMAFDTENLKPLYRLEAGKPGSSFAFEVAANIGLPKTIIEKARKKVGQKQKNVDELLVQLEKEKALALASRQKAEAEIVHYDKLKSDYEGLKTGLVDKKNEILAKAKKDALQILNNSNALVEKTIKELKQGNTQNKELRKSIDKEKANLKKDLDNEVSEKKPLQNLALGSLVRMDGQKGIGTILQMSKDRATVAFGNVKTRVNLENLHVVSNAEQQNHLKSNSHRNNNFDTDTQLELDIRGKRAEEALNECIAFVDKGIMSGFEKLRIIHGKGSGILKKVIRGELKKFNAIEKLEDELPEYGGDGITLVYLK